jgi:hypothetical protein
MPKTGINRIVAEGAEHLLMGYLMRRNIRAYQALVGNEGYDIVCVIPDRLHAHRRKKVRVEVKSRAWYDRNDRSVQIKRSGIGRFDYLVLVFMNIRSTGKMMHRATCFPPEVYTLPRKWVRDNFRHYGKVFIPKKGMEEYEGLKGFEKIANDLGVSY